nr:hypothetical protein L204_00976 [Cryptococcus depauperatus CBS 7855]
MINSITITDDKHDANTLTSAHTEWLTILASRLSELSSAREVAMDLNFGGGMAADAENVAPLEAKEES